MFAINMRISSFILLPRWSKGYRDHAAPNMAMPMLAWISNFRLRPFKTFCVVKGKGELESMGDIIAPIARDEEPLLPER